MPCRGPRWTGYPIFREINMNNTTLICLECRGSFVRGQIRDPLGHHFCSRSCAATHNNKLYPKRHPVSSPCHYCGQANFTRSKWCSKQCKEAHQAARALPPVPVEIKKRENSQRVIVHIQRSKQRAVELKGGACIVCGYSRAVEALVFHHLDPNLKEFSLAAPTSGCYAWSRIEVELQKCALMCNRCHCEVHEGLLDLKPYLD